MQETQNTELFSELSTEESATINGGHNFDDCYGYGRSRRYYRRPVSYHYRSYHYSRPVRYSYGYRSYGRYDCD
ncbi:hypothetical protein [Okeania sp. KiyG1]|uniref:hypothetical protein n=1 Tax=Okeania sp. KiyG1 TaxID=2720165 RepID=UPI001921EF10|nr:hypothetical protein [Okeania sp. KiyG1]GGA31892.1 hypothetical protein CYANOKiyG1_48650 [Okeania sp. KiyG1]